MIFQTYLNMENNYPVVVPNIDIGQLPQVIGKTIADIKKVDEKIRSAMVKANEAKGLADVASNKKAGFALFGSDKKEAIEALQKSNVSLANALVDTVDANEQLFQNQKRMSEGLRYLFGLGVMNIAANRTVVRELEKKMKHASKEELSDLARHEINNVVLQLRAQEDMQYKIDKMEANIRELVTRCNDTDDGIESFKSSCSDALKEVGTLKEEVRQKTAKQEEAFKRLEADLNASVVAQLEKQEETLNGLIIEMQSSLNEKLTLALSTIEARVNQLEQFRDEELSRKSFFISKTYNILTTLVALIALVLAILM